ncbi:MAG: ATP-grasp domain-containing protein [Burkholderiales bacterium]
MKRVLLLLPTTSYRNADFLAAARALHVDIIAAADYCEVLAPLWGMNPVLSVPFDQPEKARDRLLNVIGEPPPDAVMAVDDAGLELAGLLNEHWRLPGNPVAAVRSLRDKLEFRLLQTHTGLNCPRFYHLPNDAQPSSFDVGYPLVVKPRRLSASRGVIRCDDSVQLSHAVARSRGIQQRADRAAAGLGLMIESYIPGTEHALEGLLQDGRLRTLALFDKPDPLDGPYFEETIYVTPSRLPDETQEQLRAAAQRVCLTAGLRRGPVHAEARVNATGVWLIEVAARSIGGLCSRTLRHTLGVGLEQLVLAQALGEILHIEPATGAAAVMMIPIPITGLYRGVRGLEHALSLPGIEGIIITAEPGQWLAPPPEGRSYLGFIFARADSAASAESAARVAHRQLIFDIQPAHSVEQRSPALS